MSITVVGSIAFDTVTTPFGSRQRMLGGAATRFSLAALGCLQGGRRRHAAYIGVPVGGPYKADHYRY